MGWGEEINNNLSSSFMDLGNLERIKLTNIRNRTRLDRLKCVRCYQEVMHEFLLGYSWVNVCCSGFRHMVFFTLWLPHKET